MQPKNLVLLARDSELRNCGSQILKVRNGSSATFFSPQFRNGFGSPQYCGIAELRTKIADAHLWHLRGTPTRYRCNYEVQVPLRGTTTPTRYYYTSELQQRGTSLTSITTATPSWNS